MWLAIPASGPDGWVRTRSFSKAGSFPEHAGGREKDGACPGVMLASPRWAAELGELLSSPNTSDGFNNKQNPR